jgi:hypothetical protein
MLLFILSMLHSSPAFPNEREEIIIGANISLKANSDPQKGRVDPKKHDPPFVCSLLSG